jgi:anti-anti-sigma regulatory factor
MVFDCNSNSRQKSVGKPLQSAIPRAYNTPTLISAAGRQTLQFLDRRIRSIQAIHRLPYHSPFALLISISLKEFRMAFHFCTRAWEVRDVAEGTVVTLTNRDLNEENAPVLAGDLHALVLESGQPNLYLDFANIGLIDRGVVDKVVELDERLRAHGCRAILMNMNASLKRLFETTGLEIRAKEAALARSF